MADSSRAKPRLRRSSEHVLFSLTFRRGVSRLRTATLGLSALSLVVLLTPVAPEKLKVSVVEVTGVTRTELMWLLLLLVAMSTLAFAIGAYGDWPRIKEVARQIASQHESNKEQQGVVQPFWTYFWTDKGFQRAVIAFAFLPLLAGFAACVLLSGLLAYHWWLKG